MRLAVDNGDFYSGASKTTSYLFPFHKHMDGTSLQTLVSLQRQCPSTRILSIYYPHIDTITSHSGNLGHSDSHCATCNKVVDDVQNSGSSDEIRTVPGETKVCIVRRANA